MTLHLTHRLHPLGIATIALLLLGPLAAAGAPDQPSGVCTPGNLILDGGFEDATGSPLDSPSWTETSDFRTTPLCTIASCGTEYGTERPRTGAVWMRIGGVPPWDYSSEFATVSQSVLFPGPEVTAVQLRFFLRAGYTQHSGPGDEDQVSVEVDGVTQAVFPEPPTHEATYSEKTVDLLSFADGGAHTITLKSTAFAATTFHIDDVGIHVLCGSFSVPFALAVDAGNNGVLQLNETVTMAPTWRNIGGTPLTLTGALSNFAGIPGPTYTLIDSTGSYGTIAPAGNATCTDCYSVSITGTRPASVHWDASVLETITPTGANQPWLLHVGDSFIDVPSTSPFYRFVETLFHKGITSGCGDDIYCPGGPSTREQMAVFVVVAKDGPGPGPPSCSPPDIFNDVPSINPFCRFIEELANRGVVSGCGGGNYCPGDPVTREQMAVFVLRTLDPTLNPPACISPTIFNDVPDTSPFCRWIEELARRGVVSGCGGGAYCPTGPVTREQMGVFIAETFGLRLYGP